MKFASPETLKSRGRRAGPEPVILVLGGESDVRDCGGLRAGNSQHGQPGGRRQSKSSNPELPKVRHMVERAHRTYFVVNAGVHFGLPVTRPTLVLILRQLRVAVLVDRIERMAEISSGASAAACVFGRGAPVVSRPGVSGRSRDARDSTRADFLPRKNFASSIRSQNLQPHNSVMEGTAAAMTAD